eukprot:CAMPEP_0172781380 /NCGR_PEP_ID=MMETSP1074-20121228/203391_1 /TAXON_ID=2916 /ORGANISM="Ceratium fusus, Strain PA161109" /LENGTH=1661 /DNA_ID=CAMNT_0013618357 /DNA_START=42 /DNA_END=5028 /DNA_ORIENTATION=+
MAPPKAVQQQGLLAQLRNVCKGLGLEKVLATSWNGLREAASAFTLDLSIDIEHISVQKLEALTRSLELASTPEFGTELWEWLAKPVEGSQECVPRVRALLVILGQVCGTSNELIGAAGAAYFALLMADGADQQWSVLFQPGILRQILRAFRCLRRGDLKPKKERRDNERVDDGTADSIMEEGSGEGDKGKEEDVAGGMHAKEALELLRKLSVFFLQRGMGSSVEAGALVVEELAVLMVRPSEETVARHAASALSALVARAGNPDDIRRVAAASIRATMPAVLMTQERLNAFQGTIPRPLQQARIVTLSFWCGLIRSHPELLSPQEHQATPIVDEVQEDDGGSLPKKRGRRKGQDKRATEDDQNASDADGGNGEEPSDDKLDVEADAEGGGEVGCDAEKKVRRRRPRGSGMNDPILAVLELVCILTPDRSEWRSYAADSVMTLLSHAADVERQLEMIECVNTAARRRASVKTKDPTWNREMELNDGDEAPQPLALPICEGTDALAEGALVAPLDSEPRIVPETPSSSERFIAFLERILESERTSSRVLATELAVTSLERSGQLARRGAEDARVELVRKLLMALLSRCADGVPTVRSRALCGVSSALQNLARPGTFSQLLGKITLQCAHPQYLNLPGMFRAAAADEKPTVRRASLTLFDAVVPLLCDPMGLSDEQVALFFDGKVLASLSADESIMVRKAAISSLALLLRTCPFAKTVCQLWVQNVLPLVLDVETSVVERALDELEATVLNPIAESTTCMRAKNEVALLPAVLQQLDSEATEYLQRGLKLLAVRNEGKLPRKFVGALFQWVQECMRPLPLQAWPLAVWSMLEEVTSIDKAGGALAHFDLILDAWRLFSSPVPVEGKRIRIKQGGLGGLEESGYTGGGQAASGPSEGLLGTKILRVLDNLVLAVPEDQMEDLMGSLCAALASFAAPTCMIRALMCTIERIEDAWKARKVYAQRAQERAAWRSSFLKSIQGMLTEYVTANTGAEAAASITPRRLCGALFTLGELAMMDISVISQGVITQVQTIATNTIWRNGERVETDARARGHAFAALGKFCLRKDVLAKKSVELLVLHLNPGESLVVRNNVLVVLGDICSKYTSLVDRFVPHMTDLFRDPGDLLRKQAAMIMASLLSEDFIKFRGLIMLHLLRKQAAMIMASLLSEDFIKFRGLIMLRFIYLLGDPSDAVCNFVECLFARILHSRNATMFSQNFLDVICALNAWHGLANFQGAHGNEDFSLLGSSSRRAKIYRFMLTLMSNDQKFNVCAQIVTTLLAAFVDAEEKIDLPVTTDEPAGQALSDGLALLCCKEMASVLPHKLMSNDQKFNVCAQIVTTLLAAFVDAEEKIDLPVTTDEPAGQALSDGLALLCCKEMRICFTTQRAGQDEDGEADGTGDKAGAEAARGVLSSILKRNMCENIVPVLIQLKNLMEARHSPFLRQLRHCLREILRDFKDDLKTMLAGDAQLANEIAFDLQNPNEEDAQCGDNSVAKESIEKLPLTNFGGASRRVSLASMMKTPGKNTVPLADICEAAATEVAVLSHQVADSPCPSSVIPKARHGSMDSVKKSSMGAAVEASPRPLIRRSSHAATPTRERAVVGSPQHVPSLPVAEMHGASQDVLGFDKLLQDDAMTTAAAPSPSSAAAVQQGGGKRRRHNTQAVEIAAV